MKEKQKHERRYLTLRNRLVLTPEEDREFTLLWIVLHPDKEKAKKNIVLNRLKQESV